MKDEFKEVRRQCHVVKAFFKAILFMCSQSIIHSLNDEQDIQKLGGLFKVIPFTITSPMLWHGAWPTFQRLWEYEA